MLLRVLVTTATPNLERRLRRQLRGADVAVLSHPLLQAERLLEEGAVDVAIVDARAMEASLPDWLEKRSGDQLLAPLVVLATPLGADEMARCLAAGCWGVLSPDVSDRALRSWLISLLERVRHQMRWAAAGHIAQSATSMLTRPRSSSPLTKSIRRMASVDSSMLIRGEAGVGKMWAARAIHAASRRASQTFVAMNCRHLSREDITSALFGQPATGGVVGPCAVLRAHRGTLWLDGIEALPAKSQELLLRLLRDRVAPLQTEARAIAVDVRVMASLGPDQREPLPEGLRSDLYYRLANVTLEVPPLRERRKEIPDLLDHYLRQFAIELGRDVQGFAHDALNELVEYDWPGNVRELINLVERSVLLCRGSQIVLPELPEPVRAWRREREERRAGGIWTDHGRLRDVRSRSWRDVRQEVIQSAERTYLAGLLRDCEGRIGETAARAGMLPRALYAKMKQHGLRKEAYRPKRKRTRRPKMDD